MKYELKGIKYAAFSSEETACYQAGIYRDGRKVGEVSPWRWQPNGNDA